MQIFIVFICGIANFAMHKAMMESNHPMIAEARGSFTKFLGPHGSYILEFIMLALTMIFADMGILTALIFYGLYTLAKFAAAYFIYRDR